MSEAIHATAVLCGTHGVLIRGAPGAGKSTLTHALIARGARLVGDDRIWLSACQDRLLASVPAVISGLVELRGRGLVTTPFERAAIIRLVADIVPAETLERMPEEGRAAAELLGVVVPRQQVPAATEAAVRLVDAALEALSPNRNMGLRSA